MEMTIDVSTVVQIGVAVIGAAVTFGGAWLMVRNAITKLETRMDFADKSSSVVDKAIQAVNTRIDTVENRCCRELTTTVANHELRITRSEDNYKGLFDLMKEMNDELHKLRTDFHNHLVKLDKERDK